jgi:metallophosphoesterase superfamily enzyme
MLTLKRGKVIDEGVVTMKTLYIADMHLGHGKIVERDGRPFTSVEEMDEHHHPTMVLCRNLSGHVKGMFFNAGCIPPIWTTPREPWMRS